MTGSITTAPTSNSDSDSGAAAACASVTLNGTIHGHRLTPSPRYPKKNSAILHKNGLYSSPRRSPTASRTKNTNVSNGIGSNQKKKDG